MPNLDQARPFEFDTGGEVGVVLLHGFTGAPQEVEPLGRILSEAGISSLGPLLPGHGSRLEELNEVRWQDWNGAAREAVEAASGRWSRVLVGGLSMGGALALHLGCHQPDLVCGVFALAAPARLKGLKVKLVPWLAPLLPVIRSVRPPEEEARLQGIRVCYDGQPLYGVLQLIEFLDHLRLDLPELKRPTLLVHSRSDQTIPFENQAEIASLVGTSELRQVALDRSDHIVTQDVERDEVFRAVTLFVREVALERSSGQSMVG